MKCNIKLFCSIMNNVKINFTRLSINKIVSIPLNKIGGIPFNKIGSIPFNKIGGIPFNNVLHIL